MRVDTAQPEIWLSRAQLAALFGHDVKTIGKHVNNALREELAGQEDVVVAKLATTTQHGGIDGVVDLVQSQGSLGMLAMIGVQNWLDMGVPRRSLSSRRKNVH